MPIPGQKIVIIPQLLIYQFLWGKQGPVSIRIFSFLYNGNLLNKQCLVLVARLAEIGGIIVYQ